ncbi:MAG: AraC family transcriptional regulator [Deltaproteobacteria bacterium]|nr:AraC family transcriptional regulator [Deltaproteobacteria bacterium]
MKTSNAGDTAENGKQERQKLCARILELLPEEGRIENRIEGLALTRYDRPSAATVCFYRPMLALVVQGFKHSRIGIEECAYGAGQCVVVGVDMPGVYQIGEASPDSPFLSFSLTLNRYTIANLLEEMPPNNANTPHTPEQARPVVLAPAGPELLAACGRLLGLLTTPEKIAVLAPLVIKEIHFHLLTGAQGDCLRLFCSGGTRAASIAEAISQLRSNYAEPLNMEELAGQVGMSRSTFNRHFRQVTGLSPLQFQKRLRLYEAERLMLFEGHNASSAALAVGYESGSQFTREYKRLFGQPPRRDVTEKRM